MNNILEFFWLKEVSFVNNFAHLFFKISYLIIGTQILIDIFSGNLSKLINQTPQAIVPYSIVFLIGAYCYLQVQLIIIDKKINKMEEKK